MKQLVGILVSCLCVIVVLMFESIFFVTVSWKFGIVCLQHRMTLQAYVVSGYRFVSVCEFLKLVFIASESFVLFFYFCSFLYFFLAVSRPTRPPAGDLSRCALCCLGPAGLCPPYLSRFALEFSRPLRASDRIFISYRAARSIVSALACLCKELAFTGWRKTYRTYRNTSKTYWLLEVQSPTWGRAAPQVWLESQFRLSKLFLSQQWHVDWKSFVRILPPQCGRVVVDKNTFPIFDKWIRSGDIRDQRRKLLEIAPNFGRFLALPNFWRRAFQKLYPSVYHSSWHVD